MSPIFLLLSVYAVLCRLLWPMLTPVAFVVIGLSGAYSLLAMMYIQTNVAAQAGAGRAGTVSGRAFDLALPLFGAMILPAPYMAGALALLWGFESRPEEAWWAAGAAAAAAAFQYGVFRYMRNRISSPTDAANDATHDDS